MTQKTRRFVFTPDDLREGAAVTHTATWDARAERSVLSAKDFKTEGNRQAGQGQKTRRRRDGEPGARARAADAPGAVRGAESSSRGNEVTTNKLEVLFQQPVQEVSWQTS